VRRFIILSTILCVFGIIPGAHAMQTEEWSFLGSIPGRWEGVSFTSAVPTKDGLLIKTEKDGRMFRTPQFTFPVDAMRFTLNAPETFQVKFLWNIPGTSPEDMVELPFYVVGTGKEEIVELPLANYREWNAATQRIGLMLPAGTELLLKKMEFLHWNFAEKILYGFRSFWMTDGFRPYTINFLWGPRITANPIANAKMFHSIPPRGWSAFRFLYPLLFLAGAGIFVTYKKNRGPTIVRTQPLFCFLMVCFGLWLLLDIRMGMEYVGYAVKDYETYIAAEPGKRTFRDRNNFNDFVDAALPHIRKRNTYLFMSGQRWPYLGAMRYLTYPSVPLDPGAETDAVDTVVVYERPDITVNGAGELMYLDQKLSTPGTVLLRFGNDSFVFRMNL